MVEAQAQCIECEGYFTNDQLEWGYCAECKAKQEEEEKAEKLRKELERIEEIERDKRRRPGEFWVKWNPETELGAKRMAQGLKLLAKDGMMFSHNDGPWDIYVKVCGNEIKAKSKRVKKVCEKCQHVPEMISILRRIGGTNIHTSLLDTGVLDELKALLRKVAA